MIVTLVIKARKKSDDLEIVDNDNDDDDNNSGNSGKKGN